MTKEKISIADNEYIVAVTENEKERLKGLKGVKTLKSDRGMLFTFDEVGNHTMTMKDTLIPLQQIFLDEDREVIKTVTREPKDDTLIGCEDTKYVLEVNPTKDVELGDILEFDKETMQVLDPDGNVQGKVYSGQRIVSRKETKVLIRKAKRAYESKDTEQYDNKCKSLGKYMFKVLKGQNERPAEYTN